MNAHPWDAIWPFEPGPDAAGWSVPRADAPPLRPAVFIDKDGTLVENVPYNVDPARLSFRPGALAALQALDAQGFALLVVTNQSGLAQGLFSRAQFARLQAALEARLLDEAGIRLLGVEVCPHAPGPTGAPRCLCRKPAPGMLQRAACRHGLDLARSWMVGDILDDVEAGHRAGCRSILLDSGGETLWRRTPMREPDIACDDWGAVVSHIEQHHAERPATPRALRAAPRHAPVQALAAAR